MIKYFITVFSLISIFSLPLCAEEPVQPKTKVDSTELSKQFSSLGDRDQHKITEIRKLNADLPQDIQNEIKIYKKTLAEINAQKKIAYDKLSEEAKESWSKESRLYRFLSLSAKQFINQDNVGLALDTK